MEVSTDLIVPGRRLGRRPPKNAPALMLRDFISAPAHPAMADHFSKISAWGLYQNDIFGICGPTCAGNSRRLVTKWATGTQANPTQQDVNDLYRRSGNPGFTGDPSNPGDDNGVDMQTMCEAMLSGGLGGVKPLGFAKVSVSDLSELDAAIDVFGFVLYGSTLQVAQQAQTNNRLWDYQPSAIWGGHATLGGKYKEDPTSTLERRALITWEEVVEYTDAWEEHQMDEAWAVIWPETWDNPNFDSNFDKAAFAKAWSDITGKKFPADVPPSPTPSPSPTPAPTPQPTPGGGANFQLDQSVVDRIDAAAHRQGEDPSAWLNHHLKTYFKIN